MRKILAIADRMGQDQLSVARAVEWADRLEAKLDIAGFVFEHIANLPGDIGETQAAEIRNSLIESHRSAVQTALEAAMAEQPLDADVEIHWEKRVGDWINHRLSEGQYDLVLKGVHRSETLFYTPTDWQLLRGADAPVLLLADKRWKRSKHVLAAVDLGAKRTGKLDLNFKIVEHAKEMATASGGELHVGYIVPISPVLPDLDILDEAKLLKTANKRAAEFQRELAERGIDVAGIHVASGAPQKALVPMAAKVRAELVVLGCIGRKKLAGRVIGNTAEQILRLMKADVLAIKP